MTRSRLDTSLQEKITWLQLLSLVVVLGGYLVVAVPMLSNGVGVTGIRPVFIVANVLGLAIHIAGRVVDTIASRSDDADERDVRAHVLLFTLFGSEAVREVLQIVDHRRGR